MQATQTDNDKALMKKLGITSEKSYIHRYKKYHYTKLQDAVNYAKLDHAHSDVNTDPKVESKTRLTQGGQNQS